jgi:hypothetical protein
MVTPPSYFAPGITGRMQKLDARHRRLDAMLFEFMGSNSIISNSQNRLSISNPATGGYSGMDPIARKDS